MKMRHNKEPRTLIGRGMPHAETEEWTLVRRPDDDNMLSDAEVPIPGLELASAI